DEPNRLMVVANRKPDGRRRVIAGKCLLEPSLYVGSCTQGKDPPYCGELIERKRGEVFFEKSVQRYRPAVTWSNRCIAGPILAASCGQRCRQRLDTVTAHDTRPLADQHFAIG